MAAKDTSGRPQPIGRASTREAGKRPGNPPDDVGEILDDMDEVLEENAEEIVRSYVQEGGQ
jgi:ubiquitin-like protein Pup